MELDPALGLDPEEQQKTLRAVAKACIDAGYAIGAWGGRLIRLRRVVWHVLGLRGCELGASLPEVSMAGRSNSCINRSLHPFTNPSIHPSAVTSKYKIGESFQPPPSLRITVSAIHTPAELKGALQAVQTAVAAALN